MGIPKFFRYISERYPLTSQLIQENKIPEFDNLYVDFNGIIHNCSHPDDGDAHLRLSEEQIFTAIFAYVDHLFGKIKPKKLFFMAVDGVAPRAKMNQQRSRRFRTAREAEELRERAERKGEKLPDEKAFDSNCITPGTPFMARLSAQLRYFVNKKISEDADWSGVEVVLSGHDVPGEGEHKIMEYIRLNKAQTGYNCNTRHCLYGLDADLIMLGLLSHDPHFCLLREEVKFGPAARKKTTNLQQQNFFLLHLCLLREYLDLEFQSIVTSLSFPYNLERIIDDFVLLAVFVGNDFLPHLPDLHIHENGLERLFNIYKGVLPKAGGYINNSGVIDTVRLQMVLDELAKGEVEVFQQEMGDRSWMSGKHEERRPRKRSLKDEISMAKKKGSLVLTHQQQGIFSKVRDAVLAHRKSGPQNGASTPAITFPNDFNARDRKFVATLAEDLNLALAWDGFDDEDRNIVTLSFPDLRPGQASQIDEDTFAAAEGAEDDWVDTSEDDMEESNVAVDRVLTKYSKAKVLAADDDEDDGFEASEARRLKEKIDEWKRGYYKEKLEISYDDPQALSAIVFRWVEGLQWVMFYYYSGVASWSWYYNYHYAPRISDFIGVDKMTFTFDLGTPFKPYQQLMGVLPAASKDLIPLAYRDLMYDPNSPILDFYPPTFELDMNGKKAEWEAIVKIPFLNQERLLRAMTARDHRLTTEEVQRNSFGTSTRFTYDPEQDTVFPSSLPGFFAAIHHCKCRTEPFNLPTLDGLHLVEGLCDGVFLGTAALAGFPSLKTLPHTGRLEYHHVNVFQADSKNQSMVVEIENDFAGKKTSDIAELMVGKKTFIGWPFLQEGLVVAVSDELFRHEMRPLGASLEMRLAALPHSQVDLGKWRKSATRIEEVYSKRYAVVPGPVKFLLHVRPLKGMKRLDTGALVKDYEGPEKEVEQAAQLGLQEVISEDPRFLEKDAPPLSEEFPVGSRIIFMGEHAYGVAAQVQSTNETSLSVILAFFPSEKAENEKFTKVVSSRSPGNYFQSYDVANMVGISGLALAKITSSLMVLHSDGAKTNLGLSLKFEAKGLKVMDFSRKTGRAWEFSNRAVELIREYKTKFPELFRSLDKRSDDMLHGADIFRQENSDAKIKEVKAWLTAKGVRDFEPVSLNTDRLKKETVMEIEKVADLLNSTKSAATIKKAVVQGIPRQAVLKPAHAVYRLRNQTFTLGDRVTMVQDSGSVPLCAKGVVIGMDETSIDVVWDVPFISGTTLGGRCSEYRGSVMPLNTCLNLTNRQYCASTKPKVAAQPAPIVPSLQTQKGAPGLRGQGGLQPKSRQNAPMHIMTNPNRASASHPPRNGRTPDSLPPAPPSRLTAVNGAPSYVATLKQKSGSSLTASTRLHSHQDVMRSTLAVHPSSSWSTDAAGDHGNVHAVYNSGQHISALPQDHGGAGRGIGGRGRGGHAFVASAPSAFTGRGRGGRRGSRRGDGSRERGRSVHDPAIISIVSSATP